MSTLRSYRVAFDGFGDFERSTLASFFRLADRHAPVYVPTDDAEQGDLLVVNADAPDVVQRVVAARRVNHAVFVGAHAPADAIARVERPIEPGKVLRALEQLVALRTVRFGLDVELPLAAPDTAPAVDLLLHDLDAPAGPAAPRPAPGHGGGRAVMVVDDSAIARKFLAARLQRLGYSVLSVDTGEQALELATQRTFSIFFLDIGLSGGPATEARLGGLQVCRLLKQRAQERGLVPPAVVFVSGSASATERVQGTFAGCDGYLVKPLLEPEFLEVLASVDPAFRAQPVVTAD